MKKYALRNDPEQVVLRINSLNNLSDYFDFCNEVFGYLAPLLNYSKFDKDTSSCVSNIKSKCFHNVFGNITKNELNTSKFGKFISKRSVPLMPNRDVFNPDVMFNTTTANVNFGAPVQPRRIWDEIMPRPLRAHDEVEEEEEDQ
jgi:hypothetical protein